MRGSRGWLTVAIACGAVQIVPAVSGFAQSNTAYRTMAAIDRTASGALRPYVPEARVTDLPTRIPPNLEVPSSYRVLLESMWQRSATFRRQCRRIANTPGLEIAIRAAARGSTGRVRARAQIVRDRLRLRASIEVLSLEDPAELIAHELEHVIEQLDGVDLASRAATGTSGVRIADDSFETMRAVRVGRAVSADMRRGGA